MRSKEHIKVFLNRNGQIQDITEGLISVDFNVGFDYDEGIWSAPDSGQFTLITKNTLVDPYLNPDVRYSAQISIVSTLSDDGYNEFTTIFHGYLTDINVEYRGGNEPPIITISGVDAIGILQRTLITQEQEDYFRTQVGTRVDLPTLLDYLGFDYFAGLNIQFGYTSDGNPNGSIYEYYPASIAIKAGQSVWELISQYNNTNLSQINISYIYFLTDILITPYIKKVPALLPIEPPITGYYDFSSDINDEREPGIPSYGYKSIYVNDGFNRTINQVEINNTARYYEYPGLEFLEINETFGPYSDITSMEEWGTSNFSIDTIFSSQNRELEASTYADNLLEYASTPELDIKEITFDANKYNYFAFETPLNNRNISIRHQLTPSQFLIKSPQIIGMKHYINENDWLVTFSFAKDPESMIPESEGELVVTPLTGDSSTMFNASITGIDPGDIDEVLWFVNDPGFTSGSPGFSVSMAWPYAVDPEFGNQITGTTLSWNYDDDGLLAPYANGGSPLYGAGGWFVNAFVIMNSGWVYQLRQFIEVTAAQVEANFTYSVNSQGQYTFTDLSTPDAEEWTWDFGDGTTYEGKTPPLKFYTENNIYNVSLTVSNGITTDTHTVPITVNMTKIPVRYVKLEWDTVSVNNTNPTVADNFRSISVNRTSGPGGNIAANNIVTKQETTGYFRRSGTGLPTWNPATEANYVWDGPTLSTEIYPTAAISGSNYTYDMSFTNTLRQLISIDPITAEPIYQDYFTDIADIWFYTDQNPLTTTAPVKVYVSADNVTFYEVGYFEVTYNGSIPPGSVRGFSLTKTVPWPPNFPV